MRIIPYSIQGRFLLGMLAIALVMGAFFAFALHNHMRDLFFAEARSKANLMAAHTEAIQGYVRSVLRPAVSNALDDDDKFIIEAMSTSFVTRHILDALTLEDRDFTYRRVARNARNPKYEVSAEESRLFEEFKANPGLHHIEHPTRIGKREHLMIARPVYFSNDCMRCHGEPSDAPRIMLRMYGDKRGFHRQHEELAGLDIISVPVESDKGGIGRSITMFAVFFGAGMLVLLLSVQAFFNRLVVHNLRRVGRMLQSRFFQKDEKAAAGLEREEEIDGMLRSIEAIANHLSEAREQLSEYARTLESRVEARTADLELAARERKADVRLFVALLGGLNRNVPKTELIRSGLKLMAEHFQAEHAVYVCGLADSEYQIWPPEYRGTSTSLEKEELRQLLRRDEPQALPDKWYIPVQTSGQTRGFLGLFWNEKSARPDTSRYSLALACGHQLGIALDNFDAIDAIMRQHAHEKRMLERLRQSDKLAAVGQLAAGLAHEINNPLGVIRCYAELLKKANGDEQNQADLAVILRHVEQAQSVLRDLLNFSRPHVGSPTQCSVPDMLASLLDVIRPQARSAKIDLALEAPEDLPPLRADRSMLGQTIVNLLLNAIDAVKKAAPEDGGEIALSAGKDEEGWLRITVADNGMGISEKDMPKIFDPFFTTKEPGAGTGLGLAVAFGIIRDMGGRLEAASPNPRAASGGAVFTIKLPLEDSD